MYKFPKFVEGDHHHAFYIKGSLTEIFPIVNALSIFNHSNINQKRERERERRVSPRLSLFVHSINLHNFCMLLHSQPGV